jgi:hypothetical protein
MPVKLSTTIKKIENIPNITNRALLTEFHKYLNLNGVSESHQNNNLRAIAAFAHFLGPSISFSDIKQNDLISFLDSKLKGIEDDEILSIVKYEPYRQNKASLTLLWDLDASFIANRLYFLFLILHLSMLRKIMPF